MIQNGGMWEVDRWWEATGDLTEDYLVFVHLFGPDNAIITQHDYIAGDDAYPTSHWDRGVRLRDRFFLNVPGGSCPDCKLLVGLYPWEKRLLLPNDQDAITVPLPVTELLEAASEND